MPRRLPFHRFTGRFYEKYQDRLVYGTDMGTGKDMYELTFRILETADEHFYAWDHSSYHWPLYGLDLDDSIHGEGLSHQRSKDQIHSEAPGQRNAVRLRASKAGYSIVARCRSFGL